MIETDARQLDRANGSEFCEGIGTTFNNAAASFRIVAC
jgi:hypothetical protein